LPAGPLETCSLPGPAALARARLPTRARAGLELILDRTGHAGWRATRQDGPARLGRIEDLHAVVEGSPAPDLATRLADRHLGEADGQAEAVALTTIHSAKGGAPRGALLQ
jgi:hypothetical protein